MNVLSIITINYNNKPGLADTFASVFSQTHSNFEYIVIDGGSTDGSTALIEQHTGNISRWVSEKDQGIYDAMNKGITASTGEYLIFLNSGDCLHEPDTLERCLQYLSAFPAADVLYADIYMTTRTNSNLELYTHPRVLELKYFKNQVLNQQATLFRSSLFLEFGLFPSQYKLADDYWLYLRSFIAGKQFIHLDFIMVRYDFSGVSLTSANAYLQEQADIWKNLVPEPMRRRIDRLDTFQKSRTGKLIASILSKFRLISS